MPFSSAKSHCHLTENMILRCLVTFGKIFLVDHVSIQWCPFFSVKLQWFVLYSELFNKFSVLTLEKLIFLPVVIGGHNLPFLGWNTDLPKIGGTFCSGIPCIVLRFLFAPTEHNLLCIFLFQVVGGHLPRLPVPTARGPHCHRKATRQKLFGQHFRLDHGKIKQYF